MKIKIILSLLVCFGITPLASTLIHAAPGDISHPFLIITPDMYTEVRNRANQQPWASMKTEAINECNSRTYSYSFGSSQFEIGDIISACSLAYVLDPANQNTYYLKIKDLLSYWPQINTDQESGDWWAYWERFTPQSSAFFESTLALDIIRDQYAAENPTQLATIELALENVYLRYKAQPVGSGWKPAREGVAGLWELYANKRTEFNQTKQDFKDVFFTQMTSDGVFLEGAGYAYNRLGTDWRIAKHGLIDILEFTGEDNTFYSDPRLKNYYEWFFGYSSTTFDINYAFGDSAAFGGYRINDGQARQSAALVRAMKISPQAGAYAASRTGGLNPRGRLLNYLLLDTSLLSPAPAPSRIFNDGAAYFREANANTNSLQAAIWNMTETDWHSHKDTNAIYFAGYGEPLLMNAGFTGASSPFLNYTWDYINHRAVSNNTALINYTIGDPTSPNTSNDHRYKTGNGISQGFTTASLDYASGDSGVALPNGHHQRDLIFIHPDTNTDGYILVFDDIQASSANANASLAFHPNTDTINTITPNQHYRVQIGHAAGGTLTSNNVGLDIQLITQAQQVQQYDGAIVDWATTVIPPAPGPRIGGFIGKFLYNTYLTDQSGHKQILTLFYPYDNTHPLPTITRLTSGSASGNSISHSASIIDYAWDIPGTTLSYNEIDVTADYAYYRINNSTTQSLFLKNATDFQNNDIGISSNNPLTIHLHNKSGRYITTNNTSTTITMNNINAIYIDNQQIIPTLTQTNALTVNLPSGNHLIDILTDTDPTPTQMPSPTPTQIPSPTPTPTPPANPPIQAPGRLEIEDYSNYYDTTPGNQYGTTGYTDDVDIIATSDTGGGYMSGIIEAGEWLEYTIDVQQTGIYSLIARVGASSQPSGSTMEFTLDGNSIGTLNIPGDTGGWNNMADITLSNVSLTAGLHTFRVNFTNGNYTTNYIQFNLDNAVLPGDANSDNLVNILDYQILSTTFTSTTDLRADFNADGLVNILDYQILSMNFPN